MSVRASGDVYCLDADTLINIQIYYPQALREVNRHAKNGLVVIPEGVFREICRKTDRLKDMVHTWRSKHNAVVELDGTMRQELARMESAYGEKIQIGKQTRKGFWSSRSGQRAADSQVVTVAKVKQCVAVSNDEAIQNACHIENVPCIGWQEFYRRMKQGFTGQGELFPHTNNL